MNKSNLAFAEGVPSLFIVQTPFQAMCAVNAIRQLKIEDYRLTLHLHPQTEKRNRQTVGIVEMYGMEYTVIESRSIGIFERLGVLFCRKGKFCRVFLGTHLYHDGYFYALKAMRNRGNLVLLDDGIATLSFLKGEYKAKGRSAVTMAFHKAVASLRKITLNNVFTVYKDISNTAWNIAFNDISLLRQVDSSEKKDVFFIGTNNSGFIREGVDETAFKQTVYDVLKQVKAEYPHDKIIYIPHGRDKSTFVKEYCEELGVDYKPLDVSVESYILSSKLVPRAIYGFTSTALYNLKMLFPESEVNNLVMLLLTDSYPSVREASCYYEKQGIPAKAV